ncbi:MAG TPA: glycosyltransferase family 2 protein [Vicinamibacterales bacterium]|nr:glycosyltransferase family 2 protein [Vicinamibacterales bacterium]
MRVNAPRALRALSDFRDRHQRTLRRFARRTVEFGIRPQLLRGRIKHLHGPRTIRYGRDELVVITVVRNGQLYVRSFLEHYRALGVVHCVFLDNGSTDDTVDALCSVPDTTVLQTDAPYDKFENTMKRYLAERFSPGRWNLCADVDELFDYPFSDRLALSDFLRYLNGHGFSAVVTQMLDMFSDVPLADVRSTPEDRLWEKFPYYDLSSIDRPPYEWVDRQRNDIRMHWGGIRRRVFGTDNGLTKTALVLMNGAVKPFIEWHHVLGGVTADVTCVLRHYPFVGGFTEKVRDAVRTRRYGSTTTDEYVAYANALDANPRLTLMSESARPFTGLEPLIDDRFLVVSDEYRRWVERYGDDKQSSRQLASRTRDPIDR